MVLSYGSCGRCRPCQEGDAAYCEKFEPLNFTNERQGSDVEIITSGKKKINAAFFQQSSSGTYAIAHERNTVKIDKKVDLKLMGPLGCGIQTGTGTVMNTLNPNPGASIAKFGVGSTGLSAVMAAKNADCVTIVAVDINPKRLSLAKKLGATHAINSKKKDAVGGIQKIIEQGVDYAVEASGIKDVAEIAFNTI